MTIIIVYPRPLTLSLCTDCSHGTAADAAADGGRGLASVACIACNVSHRPRKITLPPSSISESGRHHKSFAGRGEERQKSFAWGRGRKGGGTFLVSCFNLETSEELWTYDFARCLIGLVSCRHKFVFFSVRELVLLSSRESKGSGKWRRLPPTTWRRPSRF